MKKVAKAFLTVTFWLGIASVILCTICGVLCCVFYNDILQQIMDTVVVNETPITQEQATYALIYVITYCFVMAVYSIVPIIICPITKAKLATAKSAKQMLPWAIINVIFGSKVAAIMLFIMRDRHYANNAEEVIEQ